jgi:L-threonylcarbamoyladenylate synthase
MTELLEEAEAGIARAAALLRAGDLVAFATETVYGLGADATNAQAVSGIYAAKGRPRFNPLICHYADSDAAFADGQADDRAIRLARAFWPGPLTLVLKRRPACPVALLASAGLDTLALRVPAHRTALALLRAVGRPVAAPSANRSGLVSPTTVSHVLDGLSGRIAAILIGGSCAVGVESTVLDLIGPTAILLRPGGVTVEAIEAEIGAVDRPAPVAAPEPDAPTGLRSPGMIASHYAPSLPVRLDARTVSPTEALLAFGQPLAGAGTVFALSETGDLQQAASRLFEGLRWLDTEGQRLGLAVIAAMPIPDHGLGMAINDRLRRAAAPRDSLTPQL